MNILITGGAGFVGSNLAIKFSNDGHKVWVLDNLKRRGSEFNLKNLSKAGIEFIHGDVRNLEDLDFSFSLNAIIECSAEPSVLAGYNENPMSMISPNLIGAINCLELARKKSAILVFISTSRVYPIEALNNINYLSNNTRFVINDKQEMPGISKAGLSETFTLEGARTLYGATKLSAELLINEYVENFGMKAIINRCGVLAGVGQMGKIDQGVITFWIANHIYGKDLSYIGYGCEGKQVRDVLHVDDLFQLLKLQIDNIDIVSGNIFNIGGGNKVSTSLHELTKMCKFFTGNTIKINSLNENRRGDVPIYISDTSKIERFLQWTPKVSMEIIVEDISKWIIDNKKELEPIFK